MIVWWLVSIVFGIITMTFSSSKVVTHGKRIATALRVHPFLVGLTLVSIGTDLPEITNALMASYLGHGDINVGDSLGSAIAQITLIMGILGIIGKSFKIDKKEIISSGSLIILSLFLFSVLSMDGSVSRIDSILMLLFWGFSIWLIKVTSHLDGVGIEIETTSIKKDLLYLIIGCVVVSIGAYITIDALISLSTELMLPEYLVSLIVMGIGTSLPELVVAVSAIRKGESEIAIGDLFGSSLVDSTVSIA
ncbi:MAG: sodium:calcium antiporter, partial [Candidatus Altiarchaeota archaeon]|nr:sodium:calcium antiporter [Candidatus Altiarchaeota archaeon]